MLHYPSLCRCSCTSVTARRSAPSYPRHVGCWRCLKTLLPSTAPLPVAAGWEPTLAVAVR